MRWGRIISKFQQQIVVIFKNCTYFNLTLQLKRYIEKLYSSIAIDYTSFIIAKSHNSIHKKHSYFNLTLQLKTLQIDISIANKYFNWNQTESDAFLLIIAIIQCVIKSLLINRNMLRHWNQKHCLSDILIAIIYLFNICNYEICDLFYSF